MKKKYLYNGTLIEESDVMEAAKQSNVDVDTYIKKAGISAIDDAYSYKGKDVRSEDILDAAKKSKLGFDDYIQKAGFQKKNQIGNGSGTISSPTSSPSQDASSVTSPKNIFYVGDALKQKQYHIPEWQPEATNPINPKYPIQRTYNGQTIGFKNKEEADFYEQNNKVTPERNLHSLIMGEPKPTNLNEATEQDKTEHGNRFGYIMNNLVDGVSSIVAGANDELMQGLINVLPQSVVGGDKNEAIKQWRAKVTPQVREAIDKSLGDPISQNKKDKYDNEFLTSAIGGLMHTVPAILSPKGTKAAAFFTQAYDNGIQTINSTENGRALPENAKTIFGAGVGSAQAVILSLGLDKILGKGVNKIAVGLANKTFSKLLQNSTAPITADIFDAALKMEAKSLKSQLINAGTKAAQSVAIGAAIGGGLEVTDLIAKEIANKAGAENIFEPTSWGEKASLIGHSIASGAVGGGLLGALTLPFSKSRNYISEKVSEAKSAEDIQALKEELVAKSPEMTPEETQHLNGLIDDYVRVNSKIPDDIPNRKETADKIIEREDIQKTIAEKQQEISNVDEAFQPEMSKEIDLLKGKVDEINNDITKIGETEDTKNEVNNDEIKVGELIDSPILFNGQKAILYQDGQSIVAKIDGQNREYELGNINEIKNKPIGDYGIEHETSVVGINNTGDITVRGKEYKNNYSNPLSAINRNENGDIISVNLETPNGQKRTFSGNIGEDIAYQIHLKEINKNNETRNEFERFINTDESTAKEINNAGLSKIATEGSGENNAEVSSEKSNKVGIEENTKLDTKEEASVTDEGVDKVIQPKEEKSSLIIERTPEEIKQISREKIDMGNIDKKVTVPDIDSYKSGTKELPLKEVTAFEGRDILRKRLKEIDNIIKCL